MTEDDAHGNLAAAAGAIATLSLVGCDEQKIKELEEGMSTEFDVRAKFGEPERIWQEADGSHTLEYNRARSGTVQAHPSFTLQTAEVAKLMSDNMGKISAFLEKSEDEQMELIGDAWELPSGGRNVAVATLETIFGLL